MAPEGQESQGPAEPRPGPGPPPPPVCDDTDRPITAVTNGREVYHIWPKDKQIESIGAFECDPLLLQSVNTMSLSRDGSMWANLVSVDEQTGTMRGLLQQVYLDTMTCGKTIVLPDAAWIVAMAFLRDEQGEEQLYIIGAITVDGDPSPVGLSRVDLETGELTTVGPPYEQPYLELRGTGEGRLFALFRTNPMTLTELDVGTGALLSSYSLPGLVEPSSWALASWGGDFYIFTSPSSPGSPRLSRYQPTSGALELDYMTELPFGAVGADNPTCLDVDD
ncbi:MAG TPA: hypothetical protein VLS89_04055 [Candidatus Nanopelagicales bacterium]|nr:hypothetical protein [Candidatus Nanopelagicales bacterium]